MIMDVIEKLRVMLPHWIEHNRGHGKEFSQWAEQLAATDSELADQLFRAVHSLEEAHQALEQALVLTGGPEDDSAGHEHHHHHHHH